MVSSKSELIEKLEYQKKQNNDGIELLTKTKKDTELLINQYQNLKERYKKV